MYYPLDLDAITFCVTNSNCRIVYEILNPHHHKIIEIALVHVQIVC